MMTNSNARPAFTPTPCGLQGSCTSGGPQCLGCAKNPDNHGGALRGLGLALPDISGLPAPFNSWPVLIGALLAALFLFGGAGAVFKKGTSRRRALRQANYKAVAERAKLLSE
jgi:hypothetical protein